MDFGPIKYLRLISLIMLLVSVRVYADELTLDDDLGSLETELEKADAATVTDKSMAQSTESNPALKKTTNSENKKRESLDLEYALNGFTVGTTAFSDNYNVHAEVVVNGTNVEISKKSDDFLNIGIIGRYAILPYNKIGTDLNISVATSVNHGNANFSEITTIRTEANLGYAIKVARSIPLYFLVGAGYEHTSNKDLAEILTAGAGAFQLGGGLGLSEKFNIEFMYSYVKHAIKDSFLENYALLTMANGASSVTYDASRSSVISNLLMVRLMYNY